MDNKKKKAKDWKGAQLENRTEVKFNFNGKWVNISRRWEVLAVFPETKKVSLREVLTDDDRVLIAIKARPPQQIIVMLFDQAMKEFYQVETLEERLEREQAVSKFREYDEAREQFLRQYGANRNLYGVYMPLTRKPTGEMNIKWPTDKTLKTNPS